MKTEREGGREEKKEGRKERKREGRRKMKECKKRGKKKIQRMQASAPQWLLSANIQSSTVLEIN